MRLRFVAMVAAMVTLAGISLPAASASAASASAARASAARAAAATTPAAAAVGGGPASVSLPEVVSQTPLSNTPDISGHNTCGRLCKHSMVFGTAVVNGEVVAGGEFTQACEPAPGNYARCPQQASADYLVAFNPVTGAIDPGFTPVVTGGPVYSVAAGAGDTVYVGGAFTSVDGRATGGIAALVVDPGHGDDGDLVTGFAATTAGTVTTLAANGNALYIGGTFGAVDRRKARDIARLSATTGRLDTSFQVTLGDPIENRQLQVNTLAVTPDGSVLAIGGTFLQVNGQSTPRVALILTGGGLGHTATLDDWSAPILANNCSAEHNYVNAIDFSPDGSFFVLDTTGYEAGGQPGICDAAARFDTDATGTDVQPVWINYTGGDSFHSVAVTGNVVYLGGHNRWVNNECGDNSVCEANVVLVNGLAAVDPSTGLALPWWHPQTLRKVGVESLTPFSSAQVPGTDGGLIVGTDATTIGGHQHDRLAIFPVTSTATPVPGGPIPSGMFALGRVGGQDESSAGTAEMCVDDPGDSSAAGTVVDLSTCTNGPGQNWTVEPRGTIEINGLCLGTQNGATSAGIAAALGPCDHAATQQWTQGTGGTLLDGGASGLCLDDPGASLTNGTQLEIDSCDGDASQQWPLPAAQAPPAPPPVGPVYPDENQHDTNVPCATSASKKPHAGVTGVQLDRCLGYGTQNWALEANGTLQIDGLCLDTQGQQGGSGTPLVLGTCDGSPSQSWTPQSNRELVSGAGQDVCLDDPGSDTANGTRLDIETCTDGANQQWRLPAA